MARRKRDLTNAQFRAKCATLGFQPDFLGYWRVTPALLVYPRNAGDRHRDQLAYMVKAKARAADGEGR